MINALTVDVEDWYHICDLEDIIKPGEWERYESRVVVNTRRVLQILREAKTKATFFILGYVGERFPEIVQEIDEGGHEIATHGFYHKLVYKQTRDEFTEDLERSMKVLKDITGKDIVGHRAASFSIIRESLWALDVLVSQGLKYDSSIFPVRHPRYGIIDAPRFPYRVKGSLFEFPPSTVRLGRRNLAFGGGAYLRFLPYWYIKWAIGRINIGGNPALIYIHPWETDLDQPKLAVPLSRALPHYVNLKSAPKKLRALLEDFRFAPVKEVLGIE